MGKQINASYDSSVATLKNLQGTDAGFADNVVDTLDLLTAANNLIGGAAFKEVGTTSGRVPEIGSSGKLPNSIIDSTNTGGSSSFAGKIAALDASGKLAAAMLPISGGGTGGAGLKGLWAYNGQTGPGNISGTSISTTRQFGFTWTKPSNVSALLVFVTGGGGSGAPGPEGLRNDGNDTDSLGNFVRGPKARRGGGGAGGSTAIAYINNVAASYNIRVGWGGAARPQSATPSDFTYGGGSSSFGNSIVGQGGRSGNKNGDGGQPRTANPGNSDFGVGIRGGEGHDGTADLHGAGAGGASFWGGGYSGGSGDGVNGRIAAPGGGGGAGNGVPGVPPFTFNPTAGGHPGADGIVFVLGF